LSVVKKALRKTDTHKDRSAISEDSKQIFLEKWDVPNHLKTN